MAIICCQNIDDSRLDSVVIDFGFVDKVAVDAAVDDGDVIFSV